MPSPLHDAHVFQRDVLVCGVHVCDVQTAALLQERSHPWAIPLLFALHSTLCTTSVSADPNLEPGRKAYLIQNIMVSKYIVAQQRRMQEEQEEEGSSFTAGARGLGQHMA
eukprot:scaffold164297_cov19-Tisochrysis_lutea.AAC.2